MQRLRGCFGAKAALQIALRADADQRSAERWLAGHAEPNAENFCALLRSEAGGEVLAALMGEDREQWPAWYRALERQVKLAAMRRTLSAQRRALEAFEAGSEP